MAILIHFGIGLLFGAGLWLSGLTDQRHILGFFEIFGAWDPTVLFVMCSAVGVAFVGFRLALRRPRPIHADHFQLPASTAIDWRLVVGSAIFGVGWGLGGYCPGPALAALLSGRLPTLVFIIAVIVGIILVTRVSPWRGASTRV